MISTQHLSFTTFFSHRYKSPEVNLYFFKLFEDIAQVQFEVDEGRFSTNVTRLERMIRSVDAFIGIYPCTVGSELAPPEEREELKKASSYFRLELDLAIRSGKPAIVFYDERYRHILKCPDSVLSASFNIQEITGAGQAPKTGLYQHLFKRFCEIVMAAMSYNIAQMQRSHTTVAIVLPPESSGNGYSAEDINTIEATLDKFGYDDRRIVRYPPTLGLTRDSFTLFQAADWVMIDVGEAMAKTGLPGYLHGQFVPMMRLKRLSPNSEATLPSAYEQVMFGGVEVGYNKDTLAWSDRDALVTGLEKRLLSLQVRVKRITTAAEAESYFRSASLRKDAVFLSYAGEDREIVANLSNELKRHFQQVFDYRDQESIRPGQPWVKEVFERLASSAIGIPLLSSHYFLSKNCQHELHEMIASHDSGKMKSIIPVKLYKQPLDIPTLLQNIHYLRLPEYNTVEEIARKIVQLCPPED